jgi:vitamin B12 transporter
MYPRRTLLAALLPSLFCASAYAQQVAMLDPVLVTATRQATRASELLSDVSVIDRETIEKANTPNTTVAELLARQPGLEMSSTGGPGSATDIFIRGANGDHTLVLVDGMRVNSATLGTVAWGYLPLSQIDRIEILRGPASSLYGSDAIGGVVQIFTKRGEGPAQFNGEVGYGTWNSYAATAGVQGGTGGWHYNLQMADQHSDGFSNIRNRLNPQFNPDRDGFTNQSASGSLAYSPVVGHEFGGRFLYSEGANHFDADFPASASADYKQRQTVAAYSLYSQNRFLPGWTSTLRLGRGTDDSRNYHDGLRDSAIRTDQDQYMWQNDIKLPYGQALLALERLDQKVSSDTIDYARKHRTIDSVVLGWSARFDKHRLQINGRYDDNTQFGGKATGSAAYGYQFTDAWRASASYGSAFKAPTFNQLYWPNDGFSSGNPNLRPEQALNREVSMHYETAAHHASVTYFRNDIKDLIDWQETPPGSWFYIPVNVSEARITGWTLAYAGQVGGFDLRASADFQDPRDRMTDRLLQRRSTEHGVLAIGRNYGAWDWNVEVVGSGRRFGDAANTQRLAGYGLLNLQASYHLAKNWSVFARANNVLDKQYELAPDYGTPGANVFVGLRYAPK